jgi:hypothetical protein
MDPLQLLSRIYIFQDHTRYLRGSNDRRVYALNVTLPRRLSPGAIGPSSEGQANDGKVIRRILNESRVENPFWLLGVSSELRQISTKQTKVPG